MTAFKIWRPAAGHAGAGQAVFPGDRGEEVEERHTCDICQAVIPRDQPYLTFSARMFRVIPDEMTTGGQIGFDMCDGCRQTKAFAQIFGALIQAA